MLLAFLVFHNIDYVIFGFFGGAKFLGVRGRDAGFSGGGDTGDLETEAETEVGEVVVETIRGGGDFALDAAGTEAAGDEDAAHIFEKIRKFFLAGPRFAIVKITTVSQKFSTGTVQAFTFVTAVIFTVGICGIV